MAATTIEWSSFLHSITVSVSILQDVFKIKPLRRDYYRGFVGNATAVVSRVDSGTSPANFIKQISSVINKIMLKIMWLCFFVDTV